MTARQLYEYALIELNKKGAPSLLLDDYVYFINKTTGQFANKMYNLYDINQQKTDDLRVLKSSAVLTPYLSDEWSSSDLLNNTYNVSLPDDYLHILNCVVEFDILKSYKCFVAGKKYHQGAKRATSDMLPQLIHNHYFAPSYKNPYYYINNVNISNTFKVTDSQKRTYDNIDLHIYASLWSQNTKYKVNDIVKVMSGANNVTFYKCIGSHTSGTTISATDFTSIGTDSKLSTESWKPFIYGVPEVFVDRINGERYGNANIVNMEIRYGKYDAIFKISKVYVDYIRTPQYIKLTEEDLESVEDNSQILEFPDYICQELVNDLVKLLLENSSDPRLQTNIPINTTILQPGSSQGHR